MDDRVGQQQGNNWEVDTSGKGPLAGNCKFSNLSYDINTNSSEEWCPAKATNFTNFIYEVQVKITKGEGGGGIAFRINPTNPFGGFYHFTISPNGSYRICS